MLKLRGFTMQLKKLRFAEYTGLDVIELCVHDGWIEACSRKFRDKTAHGMAGCADYFLHCCAL